MSTNRQPSYDATWPFNPGMYRNWTISRGDTFRAISPGFEISDFGCFGTLITAPTRRELINAIDHVEASR